MAINHPTWILVLLALALLNVARGQSSRAAVEANAYLEAHNQARAEVGVKPLEWNQTLANHADLMVRHQRSKKGCAFAVLSEIRYGGNQMWTKRKAVTAREVVEEWVKQKEYYDYASNTCKKGHECDVYTQIVWRDSRKLGCAQTMCRNEGIILTICYYNPAGNVVGEQPY